MSKNSVTLPKRDYKIPGKIGLKCPVCKHGVLEIKENDKRSDDCDSDNKKPKNSDFYDNLRLVEYDRNNEELRNSQYCDNRYLQYGFYGVLECENPNCHERIVFAGNSSVGVEYSGYEDDITETYYNIYNIEYIERPPHLIEINGKIPQDIKDALLESFKLYWIDFNSCANKIRVCLERIMDEFSEYIPPNPLGLSKRIESLVNKITELEGVFKDAKWVGDSAYYTKNITEDDLCDGYEMLKCVLNKLFPHGHKNQLAFKTKSIFSA